jgi:serine/threonine protein kinase
MGVVWSARDEALDRDVAIKLIRASGHGRAAQHVRLLSEARAMARLRHPNVVIVYDVGTVEGDLFIALERVEGGTLRDWLEREPRPWREVVTKFIAAGRGLAEVHAAGLIHRDFKPDNVLMGRDGAPRVSDFGVALLHGQIGDRSLAGSGQMETAVSQGGDVVGTLAYMAPEQLRGEKLTARSDQFGFCVALYEGLYGTRPFAAPSDETGGSFLLAAIHEQRISESSPSSVPDRVRSAIVRGLAFDERARWPSMSVLLTGIRGGRRGRPHPAARLAALARRKRCL